MGRALVLRLKAQAPALVPGVVVPFSIGKRIGDTWTKRPESHAQPDETRSRNEENERGRPLTHRYIVAHHKGPIMMRMPSTAARPGLNRASNGLCQRLAMLVVMLGAISCGNTNKAPGGAGGSGGAGSGGSGGTSPSPCGASGQACCGGNVCNGGGCCLPGMGGGARVCVGAGEACSGTGVAGTCTGGSCTGAAGTPCGAVSQTCCGGAVDGGGGGGNTFCTASGARCTAGVCTGCGTSGLSCCQGGSANQCGASLGCVAAADGGGNICSPCGASGQACCANDTCNAGLGCDNPSGMNGGGTCTTCGASGSACCGGGNCQSGLACGGQVDGGAGTCQPCGGAGQACCPGQTECGTGLTCNVSPTGDQCGGCGGSGQVCCGNGNNGTCTAGFGCAGRNAAQGVPGMCGACGGSGQACCTTAGGAPVDGGVSACTAPLACLVATAGNQCGTCGGDGQPCCGTGNNGACNTGLGCAGRSRANGMPGACGPCGALGQACCAGGAGTACQAGLTCTGMMCVTTPDAGGQ
jgi:hypothetical protein